MFLVMTLNFEEMKAASFVREHHGDNDAQAVWNKLIRYARDSPEAVIETERLMSVVTTVKYSPKDYNGTSSHFVTKYVETVADYDSR